MIDCSPLLVTISLRCAAELQVNVKSITVQPPPQQQQHQQQQHQVILAFGVTFPAHFAAASNIHVPEQRIKTSNAMHAVS